MMKSHAAAAKMSSERKDKNVRSMGESGDAFPHFCEPCEAEETELEMRRGAELQVFEVGEELDGHRIDFAISRLLGLSRAFAQKIVKTGGAELVPERRIKPSVKVQSGDVLKIAVPPTETLELEPEYLYFEVVYSDADIAVINKPAGLVVHPAPGHWTGTLVHGLLHKFPDLGTMNGVKRPGIVHRLDATTSGLMVVAKNGLAQESLFRQFKERRVNKEYLALCWGTPPRQNGTIDLPIARDPHNRLRMAIVEDGRESITDYHVLWSKGGYSLVRCILRSGRTHQIRVHMQVIRCPLVGDRLYAPQRKSPFGEERLFLHSWKLGFKHPRTNEAIDFTSPLPSELSTFLKETLPGRS